MNDDLGKKIEQIAHLLGQENVPDNVKELVSLFAASMTKKEDDAAPTPSSDVEQEEVKKTDDNSNTAVPNTAGTDMDRLKASNDPRVNLLNAIKPFMNSRRQKKIGNCIQLLQVAGLSRLLNDQEKQER